MENNRTDGDDPAFSKPASYDDYYGLDGSQEGLTKREYFAAMALQGLLANNTSIHKYSVQSAVEYADDLIEELNKKR